MGYISVRNVDYSDAPPVTVIEIEESTDVKFTVIIPAYVLNMREEIHKYPCLVEIHDGIQKFCASLFDGDGVKYDCTKHATHREARKRGEEFLSVHPDGKVLITIDNKVEILKMEGGDEKRNQQS